MAGIAVSGERGAKIVIKSLNFVEVSSSLKGVFTSFFPLAYPVDAGAPAFPKFFLQAHGQSVHKI